ncbi:MAG: phosphate transport system permease protein [Gaiellales bacterium]|jgi:phosphate transport system permease protein|nr:phosphate transport system permease protein [Gaiellales bacterium]MDX6551389.1 phosphate transport system permease protein [Gaiellales bacterium]
MSMESPQPLTLPTRSRPRFGDLGLRTIAGSAAVVLTAIMVAIVYQVVREAHASIGQFGLGFLTDNEWNAVTNRFGALDLIWGTLYSSLLALLIAVPVAIAIGLYLSELAPSFLRTPVALMVELLAAIPSVVLGLWGILVLGPFLADHVEPFLGDNLGFIPLFSGTPSSHGMLPAVVVLTIMIVPIVASISRELFSSVPSDLKQGAMALGATRWEMVRSVAIPQVSGGLVAAVMLGFARAVGEAIAVSQVIGGTLNQSWSLFAPADTMAGRIASQYQGAATALQRSSLAYLAVILLVISLITNVSAQLISGRIQRRMGIRT